MTKAEASRVLEESLSQPSAIPDFGAADRESYVTNERNKLRRLLIEPFRITAQTSEWVRTHAFFPEDVYEMWVIAGAGTSWLLFDEDTGEFAGATGDPMSGHLELIGYHSDDALCEWLA